MDNRPSSRDQPVHRSVWQAASGTFNFILRISLAYSRKLSFVSESWNSSFVDQKASFTHTGEYNTLAQIEIFTAPCGTSPSDIISIQVQSDFGVSMHWHIFCDLSLGTASVTTFQIPIIQYVKCSLSLSLWVCVWEGGRGDSFRLCTANMKYWWFNQEKRASFGIVWTTELLCWNSPVKEGLLALKKISHQSILKG